MKAAGRSRKDFHARSVAMQARPGYNPLYLAYQLTASEPYYNFSFPRFTLVVQSANEPEPRINMHSSVITSTLL